MALTAAQEERVRELTCKRKQKIEDNIQEAVRTHLEEQFELKIESLANRVLANLEQRGLDTSRGNVREIAASSLIEVLGGSYESIDVPIGGRTNQGTTSEIILSPNTESRTETIEVPLEGGDIEDPDTMEIEVPDPEPIPLDPTAEILEDATRMNRNETKDWPEGYSPNEVPPGGLPWYQ